MNDELKIEPWEGYPADLKAMILDVYHDEGAYSADQVIERLNAEVCRADCRDANDALARISWLDRFLCDCAMDFTCHPDLWEDNREAIAESLTEADKLLHDLEYVGAIERRAYKQETSDADATALSQRINVYRCVSAALRGDIEKFQERLSRATDDTEANIRYLLANPDANLLVEKEDSTEYGFYLPSQRFFTEPLSMIAGCAAHIRMARFITKAYRRYIKFLEETGADSRAVRGRLLVDAEHILGALFDDAIDELYPEYPIDTTATEEIRRLASENPGLPIIVYAGPEGAPGAYADIKSVNVIDYLDCDPPRTAPATLMTSREKLESIVRKECEARGRLSSDAELSDEQMDSLVKREIDRYESAWSQAICINVTWKDLNSEFMFDKDVLNER